MNKKSQWIITCIVLISLLSITSYAALTDGLVSYYKLDENSAGTVVDSLNRNHGTTNGTLIYNATGKIGRSIGSPGGQNLINISDSASLDLTNNLTIGFWAVIGNFSGSAFILFEKGTVNVGDRSYFIYYYPSGKLAIGKAGIGETLTTSSVFNDAYHYYVIRHNNSVDYIYVDGVLNNSGAGTDFDSTAQNLYFMGVHLPTSGNGANATLDEVGIWNRSLSETEITQLYNSGSGLTYPFTGTDLTVTLVSPGDFSSSNDDLQNFTVNITTTSEIREVMFYLWNGSNTLIHNANLSVTDYNYSYALPRPDVYKWAFKVSDNTSAIIWGGNYTLTFSRPRISYCNTTYNVSAFNITTKDSVSSLDLNTSLSLTSTYYTTEYPAGIYSYSYTGSNSTYTFCSMNSETTTLLNFNATANALPYYPYSYISYSNLNILPPQNLTLYLVNYTYGGDVSFIAQNNYGTTTISGVSISVYDENGLLVSSLTTSGVGRASAFLQGGKTYSVIATKSGWTTATSTFDIIVGQTTSLLISMAELSTTNTNSSYAGLIASFNPTAYQLSNSTVYNFNTTITSSIYDINSCNLELINNNGVVLTSSSGVVSNASGLCIATFNYNTSTLNQLQSKVTINVTDGSTTMLAYFYKNYGITNYYEGEYSIMHWLRQDIKNFDSAGFGQGTRVFIIFMVIAGVTFWISSKAEIARPEIVGLVALILILFFSFTGFLTVDFYGLPNYDGFKDYFIFACATVIYVAFEIVNRHL